MQQPEKLILTLQEELNDIIKATQNCVIRQQSFPKAPDLIKVAIGMRRSGKSYFLYQSIRELLAKKIPRECILYINFEDERLIPLTQQIMGQLIDAFFALYPENYDRTCYLFLDEVQNVEGWPLVVRRFHDKKNIQIFITGSSSKLLSKEIATELRGRTLSTEIFPYSFLEYQQAHHLPILTKPFGKKSLDISRKQLLEYFTQGGFPGVQGLTLMDRREVLQNYVETVVMRDIIERHNINNIALIRYLINSLIKNFSSPYSIHKFYQDIKSQGYQVGKETLYNYLQYIEDAYLLFTVPVYSESIRRTHGAPKKIYVVDNGLVNANLFSTSEKLGQLFENQIHLDLRRRGDTIHYFRTSEDYEVDFLSRKKNGELLLLQVTWDKNNPQTLLREERALSAAEKETGLKGRLIDLEMYIRDGLPD